MRLILPSVLLSLTLAFGIEAKAGDVAAPQSETNTAAATDANSVAPDLVDAILDKAGDKVIVAGYENFATAASSMQATLTTLCATPSQAALADAQKAFGTVASAWSKVETIKMGPVLTDNRQERILFYPDKTGSGLKKISAALAAKDPAALTPEKMQGASVAVQGLGGLEYILFGTGFEELKTVDGAYRCQFAQAVGAGLAVQAETLKTAWAKEDGIQHDFKNPAASNALFQTDKQAVTALLGTLVHGLDMVRKQRISTFYSGKDAPANPKKALFWRSGNTMPSIVANLEGLDDLWSKSDMKSLLKGDATAYGGNIDFNFKSAISAAKAVSLPIDQAVSDDKQKAKIDFLLLTIGDLYKLLSEDVGKAIGLGAGFTFSDGD